MHWSAQHRDCAQCWTSALDDSQSGEYSGFYHSNDDCLFPIIRPTTGLRSYRAFCLMHTRFRESSSSIAPISQGFFFFRSFLVHFAAYNGTLATNIELRLG